MPRQKKDRKLSKTQSTFDQVQVASRLRNLGERDRRILGYLEGGLCQATIAQRLNVSKPCINTHVKKLEGAGLIRKIEPKLQSEKGKRQRTLFYELSPDAKAQLTGDNALPITPFRAHRIGQKYKVLRQSAAISRDKRITGYEPKSWSPRGGTDYISFWFPGRNGLPHVTLTVYSNKTWVVWVDKGQWIHAATDEDAERLGDQAIHEAVQLMIEKQRGFGVHIQVDHGTNMGKRHHGLLLPEKNKEFQRTLVEGTGLKEWWADKSPEDKIPGMGEWETVNAAIVKPVEVLLGMAPELVKLKGMPDLLKETINPLGEKISRVEALMAGGRTVEIRQDRMLDVMERFLERMERQDARIAELEKRLNG